jgi:formylglycine-generating enzyme required for sulfatase activity
LSPPPARLRLVDPLGERPLAPEDFPLSFGGSGADVVLPGCAPGELRARLTLVDGRLAIEPLAGADLRRADRRLEAGTALEPDDRVAIDGASLWLDVAGDLTTLRVEHAGIANITQPPLHEVESDGPLDPAADRIPIEVIDFTPPSAGARAMTRGRRLPLWRIAIGVAAATTLAVLGLLLAAVAVEVRTIPEVEAPRIDFVGSLVDLRLGGRHLVLPGERVLAVTAEGYAPAALPVVVTRKADQAFVVPLERLPGRVRFDTGGVEATLTVDGAPRGTLPGEVELPAGARAVRIEAPRHEPWVGELLVDGGGNEQALAVALTPLFAEVSVATTPAGARVSVDGRELGVTPLTTTLDAGRYQLVLAHPEFRRFETPITVKPGEPLVIGPVELGLPDGRLALRSTPAGADVSVGGRYRGRSPLELALPPGVPHEVVVARAGYAPATRTVTVASRERATLSLTLEAVLGEVTVRGEPADAELFVDGASRGAANQTLTLPAAPHVLEVRKAGLATFRSTVTPKQGLPQVVEYTLTSAEEARAARLAATIRSSAGQELKLVRGGRFVMGSPRREPGRRSNEAQRTVELKRPFYIGTHEVTNAEFRQFRAAHRSGIFKEESLDLDRQPVARVGWQDAAAFTNWLSARDGLPPAYGGQPGSLKLIEPVTTGYRLPTEAEWEFVARHDGTAATLRYPWGNTLPVAARSGNYADQSALYLTAVVITGYDDGFRVAAPVGSFPPNPLGLFDLGGNVSEWTTDRYTIYVTGADQVVTDPVGPGEGDTWTLRGSSWLTGRTPDLRLAWRDTGASGRPDLGFRIARYAE